MLQARIDPALTDAIDKATTDVSRLQKRQPLELWMWSVQTVSQEEVCEIDNAMAKYKCLGHDDIIKMFTNFASMILRLNLQTNGRCKATVEQCKPLFVDLSLAIHAKSSMKGNEDLVWKKVAPWASLITDKAAEVQELMDHSGPWIEKVDTLNQVTKDFPLAQKFFKWALEEAAWSYMTTFAQQTIDALKVKSPDTLTEEDLKNARQKFFDEIAIRGYTKLMDIPREVDYVCCGIPVKPSVECALMQWLYTEAAFLKSLEEGGAVEQLDMMKELFPPPATTGAKVNYNMFLFLIYCFYFQVQKSIIII